MRDRQLPLIPRAERRQFRVHFIVATIAGYMGGILIGWFGGAAIILSLAQPAVKAFLLANPFAEQLLLNSPFTQIFDERLLFEGHILILRDILQRTLFGTILGWSQWLILRRYLRPSKPWIISTSLGYGLSSEFLLLMIFARILPVSLPQDLISATLNELSSLNYTPFGYVITLLPAWLATWLVSNITIGLFQWLSLRRILDSIKWWILTPITASFILASISLLIFLTVTHHSSLLIASIKSLFIFLVQKQNLLIYWTSFNLPYLIEALLGSIALALVQAIAFSVCSQRSISYHGDSENWG